MQVGCRLRWKGSGVFFCSCTAGGETASMRSRRVLGMAKEDCVRAEVPDYKRPAYVGGREHREGDVEDMGWLGWRARRVRICRKFG